ncbi:MAG TPA: hypothetical protein VMA74_03660 [Dyella sp.]|uniref:hypothetical protein n=1 Tax=Dyella sp. TaxID=1869338 RepID=UPI002C518B79|nr:hypothetical protein [Dyella sp.]HUB88806.1 hypothetical protein [Dyella sp.]
MDDLVVIRDESHRPERRHEPTARQIFEFAVRQRKHFSPVFQAFSRKRRDCADLRIPLRDF